MTSMMNEKNIAWTSSLQEEKKIYDSLYFQRRDTTGWISTPLPIHWLPLEILNLTDFGRVESYKKKKKFQMLKKDIPYE